MGEILDLLRDLTSPSPPDGWGEGATDKLVSEFNNYDDDVVINDEEVAAFNMLGGGAADPLDLMGNCQSKARSHKADHYWPRKKCNKATFRSVDAIGPLQNKLTVHASADTYQRFAKSYHDAKVESNKRTTVMLDPKSGKAKKSAAAAVTSSKPLSRAVNRPYAATSNKVPSSYSSSLSQSSFSSSSSMPAVTAASERGASEYSPLHANVERGVVGGGPIDRHKAGYGAGKPGGNPDIMKRPLKDRIAHLLAVRPYKKPELLLRVQRDGLLGKDNKNVFNVAKLIAHFQNNTYSLKRHMWNDVSEEWPFYTDQERALFRRSKPQNLTPPLSDGSSSSSIVSGLSSSSSRPASPQGIISAPPPSSSGGGGGVGGQLNKRKNADGFGADGSGDGGPASKRKRVSKYVRPREMYGSDYGGKSPMLLSSPKQTRPITTRPSPEYYQQTSYQPVQSPKAPAVTAAATARIRRRTVSSSSSGSFRSFDPSLGGAGACDSSDDEPEQQQQQQQQTTATTASPPMQEETATSTSPSSTAVAAAAAAAAGFQDPQSVDDQQQQLDEDWRNRYVRIETVEQRKLYKEEFARNYSQYMVLHTFFSEQGTRFSQLNHQLQRHKKGSTVYKELESQIMKEYNAMNNEEFKQKHRDFKQLHLKMVHIKQLVQEYDNIHYRQRMSGAAAAGSHSHGGDRTDRNRTSVASR